MDELEIKTVTINSRGYVLFLAFFCFGLAAIGMFLAIMTDHFVYGAVGIVGAIFIPYIFEKRFRRNFSKTAILRFNSSQCTIDLQNIRTHILEQHNEFKFSEIKFFKSADSAKDDSALLKLYLRDGRYFLYTFLEQGKGDAANDIVRVFPEYFQRYNEDQPEDDKIKALPIFLATKKAKYYLIGLTILLIAAIILQIIYAPNAIPATLISGLILYLLIFLQRKRDLEQYNKMK